MLPQVFRALKRGHDMIAVFRDDHEIIVAGLNADGSPIDADGTLFGPDSGRNMDEFERQDVDNVVILSRLLYK